MTKANVVVEMTRTQPHLMRETIVRQSARQMLAAALRSEAEEYLDRYPLKLLTPMAGDGL
jgi:hypothetical protein